jgi:hypothetical protein
MAIEEVVNVSADAGSLILVELGKVGLWLQALGVVIVLWLVFQIVALIVRRKNRFRLKEIESRLDRIEKKLDKVLKGRK